MSERILFQLVQRAVNDKKFREEVEQNLDQALANNGYLTQLTKEELTAVKDFHSKNKGLTVEELNKKLSGLASTKKGGG